MAFKEVTGIGIGEQEMEIAYFPEPVAIMVPSLMQGIEDHTR